HKTRPWTLAELHRLPDDGNRYELVRGELFATPAPRPTHEVLAELLSETLTQYVAAHGLGRVCHPRAIVRIKGSEVEPDLYVRSPTAKRLTSWNRMPRPILVVEIVSDSTRRRDYSGKRSLYRDAGIPEYWIVDGEDRTITVVRPSVDDVAVAGKLRWQPAGASKP